MMDETCNFIILYSIALKIAFYSYEFDFTLAYKYITALFNGR